MSEQKKIQSQEEKQQQEVKKIQLQFIKINSQQINQLSQNKKKSQKYVKVKKCPYENEAFQICTTENCNAKAFVCLQNNCQCRTLLHKQCDFTQIKTIVHQIKQKRLKYCLEKKIDAQSIKKELKEMIELLRAQLVEFQMNENYIGLQKQQKKFMQIFQQKIQQNLQGNDIFKLRKQLKKIYIQKTKEQKKYEIQKYLQIKKVQIKNIWHEIQSIINNKINLSVICNDWEFINSLFPKKIKQLKLIYRASQNNFQIFRFHEKCDDIGASLILVQTEFNKKVGGYTPLGWKSKVNNYIEDKQKQSFLFSLTNKEKYQLLSQSNSIYCDQSQGPAFGGGHDLYIGNQANIEQNCSYANFPYSYSNGKIQNSQESFSYFSGALNSFYFKIKQWQVFQVTFNQI